MENNVLIWAWQWNRHNKKCCQF